MSSDKSSDGPATPAIKDTGMYWGFLHINGDLVLRDWYGVESAEDMSAARNHELTVRVFGPFAASGGDEASRILEQRFKASQII